MKKFFGEDALLGNGSAAALYAQVKDLPIIDYHCHLDASQIAADAPLGDIGELWLAHDHYKWRAMRLCGVDERLITGDASWEEKFLAYASVVPQLIGNPLYYWTHLELKQIFGIDCPLNARTAADVYARANEKLKTLTVRALLGQFRVRYVATTNDPTESLDCVGKYGDLLVAPTFRPDRLFSQREKFLGELGACTGGKIGTLAQLCAALSARLDLFCSKGCKLADHGFYAFPHSYASEKEAEALFARRDSLSAQENDALTGYLFLWLAREYAKRGMLLQMRFSVVRNVNSKIFALNGPDSGCDVFTNGVRGEDVIAFLDRLGGEGPEIVLYSLDPGAVPMLATITGAFRKVRMGAAWWFNDTAEGIRDNLSKLAEYSCLGTHLGMLTDSRSFSSYSRFDFFRRLLCDYVGGMVERGEYAQEDAEKLVRDICYDNVARQFGLAK